MPAAILENFEWPYLCNGHPIYFMFGSGIGFSGTADRMAPLPVGPNLRWRSVAILSKNSKWHNSGSTQDTDMMSSSVVGLSGTADLMVIFSVSENPRWRLAAILDILKYRDMHRARGLFSRDRGETETKAFRARDRDEAEAHQLRGETEPRHYCASRRPRDRGVKTEATSHIHIISFGGLM